MRPTRIIIGAAPLLLAVLASGSGLAFQRTAKPPEIRLRVAIDNFDSLSGQQFGLQSDSISESRGDYVDGVNNVWAWINETGRFYFVTNYPYNKAVVYPTMRFVSFLWTAEPGHPNPSPRPPETMAGVPSFWINSDGPLDPPLQYLQVGQSRCSAFRVLFSNPTINTAFDLHWRADDVSDSLSPVSAVTITKISDAPMAWTIVPSGQCNGLTASGTANLTSNALKGSPAALDRGYFSMPFHITITQK